MKLEMRERPYDIYAILIASTLLLLVILMIPENRILRIAIGLPFILFFPGYVLISALYPERKQYFDREGNPLTDEEAKALQESLGEEGFEGAEQEEGNKEDEGPKVEGKGLDNLERLALSLGLSVAITPLIGLALNYTYEWDPKHLGIREVPVLVSLYCFIMAVGAFAVFRRMKTPIEHRFGFLMDIGFPKEYGTADKLLTVGIIAMMTASVSLIMYMIVVPREGESFTEFYVLGPNGKAEGYPRNLFVGESKHLTIGIGNHEHEDVNFTLVMTISPLAQNVTVVSLDSVAISMSSQPSMPVMVGDGRTVALLLNFSITDPGAFKLRFLLFRDGAEYRDLHIWVKVFGPDQLVRSKEGDLELYLTGPDGDPAALRAVHGPGKAIELSVGATNLASEDIEANITLSTGTVRKWSPLLTEGGPGPLDDGSGLFTVRTLSSKGTIETGRFEILLPEGDRTLRVDLSADGRKVTLTIEVAWEGGA